jgi:hypothetical protein
VAPALLTPTPPASWAESAPCENMMAGGRAEQREGRGGDRIRSRGRRANPRAAHARRGGGGGGGRRAHQPRRRYLALEGIYLPIRTILPNSPTLKRVNTNAAIVLQCLFRLHIRFSGLRRLRSRCQRLAPFRFLVVSSSAFVAIVVSGLRRFGVFGFSSFCCFGPVMLY